MNRLGKDSILRADHDFLSLCRSFPPKPIRNHGVYQDTCQVIATLEKDLPQLTTDQRDYLELLRQLVELYELKNSVSGKPRPLQLLRQLIDEHRLNKSDISRILDRSCSLGSMILSGQRAITEEHARRLGRYFGLRAEDFLA